MFFSTYTKTFIAHKEDKIMYIVMIRIIVTVYLVLHFLVVIFRDSSIKPVVIKFFWNDGVVNEFVDIVDASGVNFIFF